MRRVGDTLIRTVWLGVICFFGLVALASFKLALSSLRPVAAAGMPLRVNDLELAPVTTNISSNTLTKGDRLQIAYVLVVEPTAVPPGPPELPAAVAPKIISRHWHEPNDQKVSQVSTKKQKGSKKDSPLVEPKPVREADACKSDGLDRIKRFFNPTTNCTTSN
jgi:hypothetical protein